MLAVRNCPVLWMVLLLCGLLTPCKAIAQVYEFDEVIDSPMYKRPELPTVPEIITFQEGLADLWLKALGRPEVELRCKAAAAISLGHRRGVPGLEAATEPLLAELNRPEQPLAVRIAVAEALIALDARKAAPSLLQQARSGNTDLRNLIEPALARWGYQPAAALWLDRLKNPSMIQRELVLAIQGLAKLGIKEAAGRLKEICLAPDIAGPIRTEAARALGVLIDRGLEADAQKLITDSSNSSTVARMCAVLVLQSHKSDAAIRFLQERIRDKEPAIAALAVGRLMEMDPQLAEADVDYLLAHPDAKLRMLGVKICFRLPNQKHIPLLAKQLDDMDRGVRRTARRYLHDLAGKQEHRQQIIEQAMHMLHTGGWRGLEQSAILLTQLDHKPAATRLVELLASPRPEVFVSSAWGLRKLDVAETCEGVHQYVQAELKRLSNRSKIIGREPVSFGIIDHQLSQLNQFLGQQRYEPASDVLLAFVPRPGSKPIGGEARGAAIWALGMIHEESASKKVVAALEDRLNDIHTLPQEDTRVRFMSAISLGRMNAKSTLPSLHQHRIEKVWSQDLVTNACGWAIERMTGEAMGAPTAIRKTQRDWFLAPLK